MNSDARRPKLRLSYADPVRTRKTPRNAQPYDPVRRRPVRMDWMHQPESVLSGTIPVQISGSGTELVITNLPADARLWDGSQASYDVSQGKITFTPGPDGLGFLWVGGEFYALTGLRGGSWKFGLGAKRASDSVSHVQSGARHHLRELLARDTFSQEEDAQYTADDPNVVYGYGYYDYYNGSGERGDGATRNPFEQSEVLTLREAAQKSRLRDIEGQADTAFMAQERSERHGIWSILRSDSIATTEELGERHGLWSIRRTDQGEMRESRDDLHGRRAMGMSTETIEARDGTYGVFKGFAADSPVTFSERGWVNGTRVWVHQDTFENQLYFWQLTGRRTFERRDDIALQDDGRVTGLREHRHGDPVEFFDSKLGLNGRRDITPRQDTVEESDSGYVRGGLRAWRATDTINTVDRALPFRFDQRDTLEASDSGWSDHKFAREDVRVQERSINATPAARETWALEDTQRLYFNRVFASDTFAESETFKKVNDTPLNLDPGSLSEAGWVNGTRVWQASDSAEHAERVAQINKNKAALRGDTASLSERTERHGKWTFRLNDSFGVQDSMRFNLPNAADDITFSETVPPFRFEWRERVTLTEDALVQKLRLPLRQDTVSLRDRASRFALGSDLDDQDSAELSESWTRVTSGTRDQVSLSEVHGLSGRLSKLAGDDVLLEDLRLPLISATPRVSDDFVLDEHTESHGRRVKLASDRLLLTEQPLQLHGKRSFRRSDVMATGDAGLIFKGIQRDSFLLIDAGSGVGQRQEYVSVQDSGFREDGDETVRLRDRGIQHVSLKLAQDALQVKITERFIGSLDQNDKFSFTEARILTRPKQELDQVALSERGKLFRKSDYLEPDPRLYRERPGRVRSALRLHTSPTGELWAVWLTQTEVCLAKRVKPDVWQGHTEVRSPLPAWAASARSVTLDFSGPQPVPVIEVGSTLTRLGPVPTSWPGRDPVWISGDPHGLAWLSPDGRTLHWQGTQMPLDRPARIVQSFSGADPGALVLDELDHTLFTLGLAPAYGELAEEVASVRWSVSNFEDLIIAGHLAPVEGTVIYE